jgi:radical SAM superfamily enzyme YgiQ (UPF0313 family)
MRIRADRDTVVSRRTREPTMRIKLILPALEEATSPSFRPIKYSLFPPLGLMTLAAYASPDDEVEICDEHVGSILTDDEPDLVAIETYVTSARRAYELADLYRSRDVHVALGGLHASSMPDEAATHADTVFVGPGEDTWPAFLADFRVGSPQPRYVSTRRTLEGAPRPRRDVVDLRRYLVPNALTVSRGCPHSCDFCYKDAFYAGGRSFYTMHVDRALADIDALGGRHLYFLDDNLLADEGFARNLFAGMRGAGRLWQAAGTVEAVLRPGMVEAAAAAGLRSLFVGFETLDGGALTEQGKTHNVGRDYDEAVRRLHEAGIMVNASFVFGMDHHGPDVFDRTVEWAVSRGVETATFHLLTPYPGTRLHARMAAQGRITTADWSRYDTRHAIISHPRMSAGELEAGYDRARRDFYRWSSIARGALARETPGEALRHVAYQFGWKKFGPMWDAAIRVKRLADARPWLERVLASRTTPTTGTPEGEPAS